MCNSIFFPIQICFLWKIEEQIMQLQFARNDLCERKFKSKIDFFSAEQNIIEISEK